MHFHLLLALDDIRYGSRPYWLCRTIDDVWGSGKVHIQSLQNPSDSEGFDRVLYYITKYMKKEPQTIRNYQCLEPGKRRNGSSRDIPGYRPNPNVFYIHLDQVPEKNLVDTDAERLTLIMKKYRVWFHGYETVHGRLQAVITWYTNLWEFRYRFQRKLFKDKLKN